MENENLQILNGQSNFNEVSRGESRVIDKIKFCLNYMNRLGSGPQGFKVEVYIVFKTKQIC